MKRLIPFLLLFSILPAQAADRQRAVALVKKAETEFYHGHYEQAIGLCRSAITADAAYPRAYTWLGAAFAKKGNTAETRKAYNKVLALAPQSDDARVVRTWLKLHEREVRHETRRYDIPYNTVKQTSAQLPLGQTRRIQNGQVGQRVVILEITTIAGREVLRRAIRDDITRQPVPEVVLEGSAAASSTPATSTLAPPFKGLLSADAVRVQSTYYINVYKFPPSSSVLDTATIEASPDGEWFEAVAAIPDDGLDSSVNLRGNFENVDGKRAFDDIEVKRGSAPVPLKVRIKPGAKLVLTGYGSLVLIGPHFRK